MKNNKKLKTIEDNAPTGAISAQPGGAFGTWSNNSYGGTEDARIPNAFFASIFKRRLLRKKKHKMNEQLVDVVTQQENKTDTKEKEWKYRNCERCGFVIPRRYFETTKRENCPVCNGNKFKDIFDAKYYQKHPSIKDTILKQLLYGLSDQHKPKSKPQENEGEQSEESM